jgi:hypothetical protein
MKIGSLEDLMKTEATCFFKCELAKKVWEGLNLTQLQTQLVLAVDARAVTEKRKSVAFS